MHLVNWHRNSICVYVLIAIVRKRLSTNASLYTMLQVLSVTAFEKTPIDQLLNEGAQPNQNPRCDNQLTLSDD